MQITLSVQTLQLFGKLVYHHPYNEKNLQKNKEFLKVTWDSEAVSSEAPDLVGQARKRLTMAIRVLCPNESKTKQPDPGRRLTEDECRWHGLQRQLQFTATVVRDGDQQLDAVLELDIVKECQGYDPLPPFSDQKLSSSLTSHNVCLDAARPRE